MNSFNGFESVKENWSKLPHQLIEALPEIKTIGEMKVIIYTLRHTWGYQDDYKKITLDEFENGRKCKDGSRIDNGTGLTKPTIVDGIKRAVADGFLFEYVDTSDSARVKKFYSLTEGGLKDLTPDVKSFNINGKESLHRTEKETIEKETTEIQSPNGGNGSNTNKQPAAEVDDIFTEHSNNLQLSDAIIAGRKLHKNPTQKLTDQQGDELLIFGKHPDSATANPSFDTIQEIQAAGWQIRNHIIEQAIAYYLKAVRQHHTAFAIPNNDTVRKDWYKAVNGHLQDHRVDDLETIYPAAIDRLKERGMTFSRPGSLTKSLPDVAMETTGDVVAWL